MENWALNLAVQLVENRIKSDSYLSHLINPVGAEMGKESDILRSVLHCEQVILNKILQDDRFVLSFVYRLKDCFRKEILAMDLGIVSYNDMCPKCFSTCSHRKCDLLNRFNDAFSKLGYTGKPVTNEKFRILISSWEAYKIPETGYMTGTGTNSGLCASENIFQFKNAGILVSRENIKKIDEIRRKKCEEIDILFKQIETVSGIKAQSKSRIIDLDYSERVEAIKKSLASSKKDKPLPPNCKPEEPLYKTIKAENDHLAMVREFVNSTLEQIRKKLEELSKIGYFQ
ncbi:MAG: hypothetical protein IJT36_00615 [Alphaproteobacteria bacterium]|nr:hypothetical protein [Alphaproteobacteria bacterium]